MNNILFVGHGGCFMREKYDLNEMLKEIEEDEKCARTSQGKASQDDIQKMLVAKKKKEKETR